MKTPAAIIGLVTLAFLMGGCAGVRTGHDVVDAANHIAATVIDAKNVREKQSQENFERELDNSLRPAK